MYERRFYICGQFGNGGSFRISVPLVNSNPPIHNDITVDIIEALEAYVKEQIETNNFVFTLILEVKEK